MSTPIHIEGWETGYTRYRSGGIIGTPTVSTDYAHSGSRSLRCYSITSSINCVYYATTGSITARVGRVYIYFTTLPAADLIIVQTGATVGYSCVIKFDYATSQFQANFGNAVDGNSVAITITTGTWYRIDYKFDVSADPSTIDFQVAIGEAAGTAATQSTYAQAATTFTSNYCGGVNPGNYEFYVDDWIYSDTSGDYPLGAGQITGLSPNAAGTSAPGTVIQDHTSTLVDDTTNPANLELDDVPLTTTGDYIKQTATGAGYYAEVRFASLEATDIWGVSASVADYSSDIVGTNYAISRIRDYNGQETNIFAGNTVAATPTVRGILVSVPSGGWTQTHVNTLRARVGFASSIVSGSQPYWNALMLQVAHGFAAANPVIKVVNE